MGFNHFILALISLSCLFTFSNSTNAPSPLSKDASSPVSSTALREMMEIIYKTPAPLASNGVQLENMDGLLNILPGGIDPVLQQICGSTDHPIECIQMATPFLDERTPIEPLSVLKAGIQAMDNKTKDALAEVTKLSQDPTTPKNVIPVLETCIEVYNGILNSDQKALEAISKRSIVQLSTELGTNMENVLGCDEAFTQAKVESPMKEMDAMLAKIIGNTLTIGLDLVHF